MAEKKSETVPASDAANAAARKGLPLKTIVVVLVLMALEGVAVFFVFGMMGGPRQSVGDVDPATLHHDDSNELREIEVSNDKFQNHSSGKVWVWDMSMYVQVRNKNAERVEKTLDQRKAEVQEGLSQIVSRAQHAQLKEPERQSLSRQVAAYLDKVFGVDGDGKPVIERLMIPKCRGFPADF